MKKNLLVTVSSNFSQMRRDELAFLPAALEIIETPPSPLSRVLGLTISAFAVCTITWAALGHLDIVSVASGKIVTRARTQIVQASETSVVDQILVEPGQKVNQWDPLIQFDTKTLLAEIERAGEELDQARLDEARLEAFLNPAQEIKLSGISGISLDKIDRAWSQLTSQKLERASKLAALRQEHEKQKSELESARVLLRKAEDILPLSKSRADIRSSAAKIEYGSKLLDLEARQSVVEVTADAQLQRQRIEGLTATIAGLELQEKQAEAEFTKNAYNDLSRARNLKNSATEALAKANRRLTLATLRAPMDGVVTQLNVRTIGAVIQPTQQLVLIGPANSPLEVEVVLPNQDVGFVHEGQEAEIKVDAYPFTHFGLLKGKVLSIAQDAEPQANPQEGAPSGSQRRADQQNFLEGSQRLLYTVRVGIDPDTLRVDGKPALLMPGMAVKAEIKTGARSILGYIMSPLSEYLSDSMHER